MYASGKFPLGIQSVKLKSDKIDLPKIDDKVNEMVEFERKLYKNNKELKLANKKQRKRMIKEIQQGHDIMPPSMAKNRRSLPMLTPSEKAKVNKWQEDDIEVPTATTSKSKKSKLIESVDIQTPIRVDVVSKKRKSIENTEKPTIKRDKLHVEPLLESSKKTDDDNNEETTLKSPKLKRIFAVDDEWTVPLVDGEIEYTIPSRKLKLAQRTSTASSSPIFSPLLTPQKSKGGLVLNPVAAAIRGKHILSAVGQPTTPMSAEKRVTIKLNMNRSQDTNEYVRQLRSSPNVPYDSNKKPTKSLLKPNLMPSPINPYYKQKIGLKFD